MCSWQGLIKKVLFHWKVPLFGTWHGCGLLTCEFSLWDHSARPARQFCSVLRTHDMQISWPPGKSRAQQSTALSPWFHTELTSSVSLWVTPHWGFSEPLWRSTLVPLHNVEVLVCPDLLQTSLNYNPPRGIKTAYVSCLKMSHSCITEPSKLSIWRHTAVSEGSCLPLLHMTVLI